MRDILARKSARRTKVRGQVGRLPRAPDSAGEEVRVGVGVRVGLVEFKLNLMFVNARESCVAVTYIPTITSCFKDIPRVVHATFSYRSFCSVEETFFCGTEGLGRGGVAQW